MKKRVILPTILVATLLLTALMPQLHEQSYAVGSVSGNWINYASSDFSGGSGTRKDPYRISSAAQLAFLAKQTNLGVKKYSKAIYRLTNDIDISSHYWTPIGTYSKRFYGELDGKGHTINGLNIKGNIKYAGLFGVIDHAFVPSGLYSNTDAVYVEYINMKNVKIDTTGYVGAIAGYSVGKRFWRCEVKGSIKGKKSAGGVCGYSDYSEYRFVSVDAKISSKGYAGGLTGKWVNPDDSNGAGILKCTVKGTIKGKDYVGGMAGKIDTYRKHEDLRYPKWSGKLNSKVDAKISGRNYVGGFVGKMGWTATWDDEVYDDDDFEKAPDVFENIEVKGTVKGKKNVGGIFGYDQDHILKKCSFSGKVTGTENVGGLIGKAMNKTSFKEPHDASLSGKIYTCYAKGMITGKKNTGGLIGNLKSNKHNYEINQCYFSGKVKGKSQVTGGLLGNADVDGGFSLKDSYVKGSVKGKANTGGVVGILNEEETLGAEFKTSYVSVSVKGTNGSTGYIFGKPFTDYYTDIEDFYYNKQAAKNSPSGVFLTDDESYYGDPEPVTNAQLGRTKLAGLDYTKTWQLRKAKGKYMYYPELRAFAKSKSKTVKTDSRKSVQVKKKKV